MSCCYVKEHGLLFTPVSISVKNKTLSWEDFFFFFFMGKIVRISAAFTPLTAGY